MLAEDSPLNLNIKRTLDSIHIENRELGFFEDEYILNFKFEEICYDNDLPRFRTDENGNIKYIPNNENLFYIMKGIIEYGE